MTEPGCAPLTELVDDARLRVLSATVVISLLISLSNLANSIARSASHAADARPAFLAAAWCGLWALAAAHPALTARCLRRWQVSALALTAGNAATVALTGGVGSSVLSVCMYAGWVASVVVSARAALATSVCISGSLLLGYLLRGAGWEDIVAGPDRHAAVTSAVLPMLTGSIGVLLTGVVNALFTRIPGIVEGLRRGVGATTPAMRALLSGQPPAMLERAPPTRSRSRLTASERAVVQRLAAGDRPKQIASQRGVSVATVRSQIKTAKRKLGARTIAELAAIEGDDDT